MPRRHPRPYRPLKPAEKAIGDLKRAIGQRETMACDEAPPREQPSIDYRPVVTVIAIVIFGLGLIAFLHTLRAFQGVD
jgi:hypothetical protein